MKATAPLLYLREEELSRAADLFFFANRDLSGLLDVRLSQAGLGRADARAMLFISRYPGVAVTELLKMLGVTKQSLGRVLKELIAKEFVCQVEGSKDRRQRLLQLTPSGRELALDLARLQLGHFAAAFRSAGPDAVAGFHQVLTGLVSDKERASVLRLISKR